MANVDKAQLRHISSLIKEIEIIEDACGGNRGRSAKKAGASSSNL